MGWWWIFWLAIVPVAVWLVAKGIGGGGGSREDSPETILKRRYAHGGIDREEYERRLTDLRK